MKTPPNRIAVVALVLLAAVISWWWMQAKPQQAELRRAEAPVAKEAGYEAGETPAHELAAAAPRGPCATALVNALDDHARGLLQRQDPISQLAYALTAPFGELLDEGAVGRAEYQRAYTNIQLDRQARVNGALLRAFALAPEDAEVRWLAAVYCGNDDTCTAPRKALLAGEPDNMTVWLRELTWARQRGDQAGTQRAFAAAADATRFEAHLGAEQEVILAAYNDLPLPGACATPEGQRELRSLGPRGGDDAVSMLDEALLRAHSMKFQSQPALFDLRERCKPEVLASIDARAKEQCRKIESRLATQGSWIERTVALESLAAMAGETDEAHWRERFREILWMQEAAMHPRAQSLLRAEDYMLDEMEAMQEALRAEGLWPAPADWLPQDERARSLILTGRPPPESRR